MAIEGLRNIPQQPITAKITDHIGANVEALNILGLVEDRDLVTDSVTRDFEALNNSGRIGEPYIALPRGLITLEDLHDVSDRGIYNGKQYPESYASSLWAHGTSNGGYQAHELDNLTRWIIFGDYPVHARLAVHGSERKKEPLLHFLNMPFDHKYSEGRKTQLNSIDEAVKAYKAEGHEDFAMTPLNAKAITFIGLVRRIKGESMPIAWGVMRDATLHRKTFSLDSAVGTVGFSGGRLYLSGSPGLPETNHGVGLSIGPKTIGGVMY